MAKKRANLKELEIAGTKARELPLPNGFQPKCKGSISRTVWFNYDLPSDPRPGREHYGWPLADWVKLDDQREMRTIDFEALSDWEELCNRGADDEHEDGPDRLYRLWDEVFGKGVTWEQSGNGGTSGYYGIGVHEDDVEKVLKREGWTLDQLRDKLGEIMDEVGYDFP